MEETPEAPQVDEARQALVDKLAEELGDAVVEHHIRPGDDVWVRVTRDAWRTAGLVVRDHLNFRYFEFLSAIDWLPNPYGKNEDAPTDPRPEPNTEIVTGYAGGDTRFQVFARVHSLTQKLGLNLKVDLPDDDLSLTTWLPVFAGVNWHEREVHEMFGITFAGHPYLQNLYLPGEFEGHPLRKDFPLLARFVKPWPGIVDVEPMPASDDEAEAETEEAAE
ncbi:MAG TPA: NADH-quinone oxidoreductase subunit C [Acidimicrobiales bacterium]|nr:NADH-quinone oxidoreductase subunit C [Acidimicrobiales bacterium]